MTPHVIIIAMLGFVLAVQMLFLFLSRRREKSARRALVCVSGVRAT